MKKNSYVIAMCVLMLISCVLGIIGVITPDGVHTLIHECLMFTTVFALFLIGDNIIEARTESKQKAVLKIRKLDNNAIIPTKGSDKSAGLDLYANTEEFIKIPPHKTVKIPTGISVEIPNGCFGAVYARSGLATKKGLAPANCVGVIDSDYRGEIIVALHNSSNFSAVVQPGDRVAQMIIQKYEDLKPVETDSLTETDRGEGGFGSTGN